MEISPCTEVSGTVLEKFSMTGLWEVLLFTVSPLSMDVYMLYMLYRCIMPVKAKHAP